MRFCFLPTEPGPALWNSPNPHILAFPMQGSYENPLPDAEPLTFFPLSMPISKAVEYWWRVYSWNLAYSVANIAGNLALQRLNAPFLEEVELCRGYSTDAPLEKQARFKWYATEDLGVDTRITGTIAMFPPDGYPNYPDPEFRGPAYKMSLTDILPALSIEIEATDGSSSVSLTTANAGGASVGGITFDGNALSCSYTNETGEPFQFVLTPLEWYSYDGIWNTATGQKN